jgi:hypothetical protein
MIVIEKKFAGNWVRILTSKGKQFYNRFWSPTIFKMLGSQESCSGIRQNSLSKNLVVGFARIPFPERDVWRHPLRPANKSPAARVSDDRQLVRQRGFNVTIEFRCHGCSSILRVPDEHLGKQARCPKCQTLSLIEPDSGTDEGWTGFESTADDAWLNRPDSTSDRAPSKNPFAGSPDLDDRPASSHAPRGNQRSPHQGNPYQSTAAPGRRQYTVAHRGGLILTLGVLSILCNVCFIPGILAWSLGNSDLQQMKAGAMDQTGEGLTRAGMVMGIVMTCLKPAMYLLMTVLSAAGA